jgi:hypothetical protein
MAKRQKQGRAVPAERVRRAKLTAEESLKRMEEFDKRKERFVASVQVTPSRRPC